MTCSRNLFDLELRMTDINVKDILEGEGNISSIIVLNAAPLPSRLPDIWGRAKLRVCADGGGDQLFHAFGTTLVPDAIVGDLDSLTLETRKIWESLGVQVVQSSCQNSTDLDKCLQFADERNRIATGVTLVVGTLGAQRLDQLMAVLNTCFALHNVVILGQECLTLFLPPGESQLTFPSWLLQVNRCGLIPCFCPVDSISTRGLKWELDGSPSRFGFLVSSSNEVVNESLHVNTSHPILFTLNHHLL